MTARKNSTVAIRCPSPLVLFGIDSRGKPQEARFRKEHASLALKAATQLQLNVLASNDPKVAEIAARLPLAGFMRRPNVRAVHSSRPLCHVGRGGGEQISARQPRWAALRGVWFNARRLGAPRPQNWHEICVGDRSSHNRASTTLVRGNRRRAER